jgi:protein-disulfide isomerase
MLAGVSMRAQAPPVLSPATQEAEPQAPRAQASPFPPVDPKNFTADSPSPAVVNSFLQAIWGYDQNRIWSVAAVLKTAAPGVSKVVVFVGDKLQPNKHTQTAFFITPDGKHAISDNVITFGAKPFAEARLLLEDKAKGPAQGAAGKDLLLVEFADLQQQRSKDAQETVANLLKEFPQARLVFENLPMTEFDPFAFQAAAEGVCVRKAKGDAAFFTYVHEVFNKQDGLSKTAIDTTLGAAATAAGADPKAMATCALTPEAKADVDASIKLGADVLVDQAATLVVNGHALPLSIPYETLKRVVAFQAGEDGIVVHVQPTLSNLK